MSRISGHIVAVALAVACLAAAPTDSEIPGVQMVGLHLPNRHVWILLEPSAPQPSHAEIRQLVCFAAYDHDRQAWSWPPEKTSYTVERGAGKARTVLLEGTITNCTAEEAISPWPRGEPTPPFAKSVPGHPRHNKGGKQWH